jgi:hypothetical protein
VALHAGSGVPIGHLLSIVDQAARFQMLHVTRHTRDLFAALDAIDRSITRSDHGPET